MSRVAAVFAAGSAALAGVVLLPAAICLSAAAAPGGAPNAEAGAGGAAQGGGTQGAGPAAVAGIPPGYLADFERSGQRFGVPWAVLAGIYREECDFGQSQLAGCNPRGSENPAGAQGPGQFLAPTWRRGLAPGAIIEPAPPTASVAGGYATDGDGDGVADVWDPADAIASTARLLAANGAAQGDIEQAVFAYNHDPTYVNDVMSLAAYYEAGAANSPGAPEPGPAAAGGTPVAAAAAVVRVAMAQLGKPYAWGGAGPNSYDCSGLVMVAYAAAGLALPHNAAAQYQVTAGNPAPLSALEPGDLVFFGGSITTIEHVGIVAGAGEMIDAPHTGAVVRIEPYRWDDLLVATRPLAGT